MRVRTVRKRWYLHLGGLLAALAAAEGSVSAEEILYPRAVLLDPATGDYQSTWPGDIARPALEFEVRTLFAAPVRIVGSLEREGGGPGPPPEICDYTTTLDPVLGTHRLYCGTAFTLGAGWYSLVLRLYSPTFETFYAGSGVYFDTTDVDFCGTPEGPVSLNSVWHASPNPQCSLSKPELGSFRHAATYRSLHLGEATSLRAALGGPGGVHVLRGPPNNKFGARVGTLTAGSLLQLEPGNYVVAVQDDPVDVVLFAQPRLTITKSGTGAASGTVTTSPPSSLDCGTSCFADFEYGSQVSLTPLGGPHANFVRWTGASDCLDGIVTLYQPTECNAEFASASQQTLDLAGSGPLGWQGHEVVFAGVGAPSPCLLPCTQEIATGSVVSLTVSSSPGESVTFSHWEGDADCSDGTVTMSTSRTCTAVFVPEQGGPCVADADTMCLRRGRFSVELLWRGSTGPSRLAKVRAFDAADSGLFHFGDPNNVELLVKILDGCPLNNRYWVFLAGATNVEFTLTVRDLLEGLAKSYANPLGRPTVTVNDTSAFSSCP